MPLIPMRVALATRHHDPSFMPLALLYLQSALAQQGCARREDVTVLEFTPKQTGEEIAAAILESTPDLVGLSCYLWNIKALLDAARLVKAQRPGVTIVLGGPEVGPVPEQVLARNPHVDIIVKGEGEGPLPAIVRTLDARGDLAAVAGICFRRDGETIDTGEAPFLTDLGNVPSPHASWEADWRGRTICVETQRGCVFRCSFCFYNKDYSVRNRRFDLDRVKEEIRLWLGRDIAELYLMDPVFNLNAKRAKEICRFIAEHNHRRIPVHSEIWAEFVDDELAGLMAAANFTFLEVGLQTTDTSALETADRRLKLQPFIDGVGHLKRHGLAYELQLIYGLPRETRASFRGSLNFAMALDPTYLTVFPLMVLPGTELWRHAGDLQLEFEPEPPYHVRSHLSMDAADIAYGHDLAAACDALQASRTIRILSREKGLTFADVLDEWIAWRKPVSDTLPDLDTMRAFVMHVCERQGIPVRFYEATAGIELAE